MALSGGLIEINTIARAEIAFILDRGTRKVRVNVFKDGRYFGFLKPVVSFVNGAGGAGNQDGSNSSSFKL